MSYSRERLNQIDNKDCVLVEFINEQDKIQTGFSAWILESDYENIGEIIKNKTEISMYWPNIDISTAGFLKSKLKDLEFHLHAVKVLAQGEWTVMKRKQHELEEYGIVSSTKDMRKDLKRKCLNDSPDNDNEPDKNKKQKGLDKLKKVDEQKNEDLLSDILKTSQKPGHQAEKIDYAMSDSDSNSDNGDQSEFTNLLQSKDQELQDSKIEIAGLKRKVLLLETQVDDAKKTCQDLQAQKTKLEIAKNDSKYIEILSNTIMDLREIKTVVTSRTLQLERVVASKSSPDFMREPSSNTHEMDSINDLIADECTDESFYCDKKSNKREKKETEELTSFHLTSTHLKNVSKSSIQEFTNNILDSLFTREELAKSSVTGKSCDAAPGAPVRPALDRERLNAARLHCKKLFGRQKGWKAMFNYTAKNKCGDARKALNATS